MEQYDGPDLDGPTFPDLCEDEEDDCTCDEVPCIDANCPCTRCHDVSD